MADFFTLFFSVFPIFFETYRTSHIAQGFYPSLSFLLYTFHCFFLSICISFNALFFLPFRTHFFIKFSWTNFIQNCDLHRFARTAPSRIKDKSKLSPLQLIFCSMTGIINYNERCSLSLSYPLQLSTTPFAPDA